MMLYYLLLLVANDEDLAVYTLEVLVIMIEYDLDRGKAMQPRMVEMLFLYCFIPFAVENVENKSCGMLGCSVCSGQVLVTPIVVGNRTVDWWYLKKASRKRPADTMNACGFHWFSKWNTPTVGQWFLMNLMDAATLHAQIDGQLYFWDNHLL